MRYMGARHLKNCKIIFILRGEDDKLTWDQHGAVKGLRWIELDDAPNLSVSDIGFIVGNISHNTPKLFRRNIWEGKSRGHERAESEELDLHYEGCSLIDVGRERELRGWFAVETLNMSRPVFILVSPQ